MAYLFLVRPHTPCDSTTHPVFAPFPNQTFVKRLNYLALLLVLPVTATSAPQKSSGPALAALKTFLEREGYGGTSLQRRLGNHLYVTTLINGNRTALVVDTGCPFTLLDRSSARKIGLGVQETKSYIMGVHGDTERFGVSKLATLGMGNCTFQNVPVQVADESELNVYARPHLDGLFGAHEMAKFGMIIDCTRQMMYVNPKGPPTATSVKLAQFLGGRGFVRIPMHFNPGHHLEIDAAINGHPVRLTIDTGASTTLLSAPVASTSGTSLVPLYHPQMNSKIGGTTFNGKRRIELLCGPSLNKSTACTQAEKHRQPSNVIRSVIDRAYPAIRFIPNRPVRPTELTKGVSV